LWKLADRVFPQYADFREQARRTGRSIPISDEGFGLITALRLPGGGELALYEPRHPTPLSPDR
jgi:hypothetical protein